MNEAKNKALQRRIKQHVIGKSHEFFAIVQPGFENTVKEELEHIGIEKISRITEGGVDFISKLDGCYRVNLCSRTVTRLLMRLFNFKEFHFSNLNKKIKDFPWELYLKDGSTIGFSIKTRQSKLYHTKRIEEEFIKGITSRLMEYDISITFNRNTTDLNSQIIFIRNNNNIFQISIDSSGELLYKRGDKTFTTDAPIRETLAASILYEAKIGSYDLLIDPMCGSGSFALEAAGIFSGLIPSAGKKFAFMNWPSFREKAFNYLKKSLKEKSNNNPDYIKKVFASDLSETNIELTKKNIKNAECSNYINVSVKDFFSEFIEIPETRKSLIVINPPYGNRIKNQNIKKIYRKIGETIRKNYTSSGYAIISPGIEYEKILSLPYNRKILFMNGGIKVGVIIKDGEM